MLALRNMQVLTCRPNVKRVRLLRLDVMEVQWIARRAAATAAAAVQAHYMQGLRLPS
jgi:hypothetical protein